jgi:HSP20 family protein
MSSNKPMKVEHATPKTMVPWESAFGFPMLARLSREFDSMFGRFGLDRPMFESMPSMWVPEMEMITKEHELLVKVDIPGMKKDDVTVEIADDHLVLRGERKHEKVEKKEGFFKTERTYGSFYRAVPLPEGVKAEGAKATMHDGVLEITMPMMKVEEKRRKLEIAEPAPVKATKAA